MSLKSNYEYIRDWANAKFLKKTDQIKVDLSEYVTKDEVAGLSASPWTNAGSNGGIIPKDNGNNSANVMFALANGQDNVATGTSSHAEGCATTASGYASHSEGYYTTAGGDYSHAEGYHTETSNYYEHASGQYNNSSAITSFSHGIGSADDDRKNAFEITKNGDVFVYGLGDYTGITGSGSPKSLQAVISGLSGDFVAKNDYKDDEEVIAAALNDLNSRILALSDQRLYRGGAILDLSGENNPNLTIDKSAGQNYFQWVMTLSDTAFNAIANGQVAIILMPQYNIQGSPIGMYFKCTVTWDLNSDDYYFSGANLDYRDEIRSDILSSSCNYIWIDHQNKTLGVGNGCD